MPFSGICWRRSATRRGRISSELRKAFSHVRPPTATYGHQKTRDRRGGLPRAGLCLRGKRQRKGRRLGKAIFDLIFDILLRRFEAVSALKNRL
jgi:hypothetical protein